jgi:hypothetical protein
LTEQPPSETPQNPKRGKARERHQRRRERQQPPAAGRGQPRQISPAGGLKLPPIPLPTNRLLLYIPAGIALVVIMVFILGRLRNDPVAAEPNAIWIGTEWTHDPREDSDVEGLVLRLRSHRIGTIYAWVSWLQADQTWRSTDKFENIKTFVQQFKRLYPEANLYGWVSVPMNVGPNNYRMDDTEIQQSIADFSASVVSDMGFDGVFLNIEPVWNDDENFLNLLRQVRAQLPEGTPLSVVVPPDWSPIGVDIPVPPLIVPGTVWSQEYKQNVALLADELAVMAYNSGLSSPGDYSTWVSYQVETFAEAIAPLGSGVDIIVGIPTYPAEPPGHDPAVENVTSAINGVQMGLANAGEAAQFVKGLAIYAEWETDEIEWAEFKTQWVDG